MVAAGKAEELRNLHGLAADDVGVGAEEEEEGSSV